MELMPKKGNGILYATLMLFVLLGMYGLRRCTVDNNHSRAEIRPSGADTIMSLLNIRRLSATHMAILLVACTTICCAILPRVMDLW